MITTFVLLEMLNPSKSHNQYSMADCMTVKNPLEFFPLCIMFYFVLQFLLTTISNVCTQKLMSLYSSKMFSLFSAICTLHEIAQSTSQDHFADNPKKII